MTLAALERRLAALHQNRTFKADAPIFVCFTAAEMERYFKPQEATA